MIPEGLNQQLYYLGKLIAPDNGRPKALLTPGNGHPPPQGICPTCYGSISYGHCICATGATVYMHRQAKLAEAEQKQRERTRKWPT
jgi:acetoacetate decarboxylase